MAVKPHTIDIVVADIARALRFYATLGLAVLEVEAGQEQVQIDTPGAATIGLLSERMMREANPHWVTPVGQRVTFACRCDTPLEVDETYRRVTEAGFAGLRAPWDAFWGQRYAFLQDPDGNRVDLYADLN